jgi:hypothetical protein
MLMFRQPYLSEDDGVNLGGGGTPTDTAGQQTDTGTAGTTGSEGQQQTQTQQPQIPPAIKVKFNHEEREIPYEEAVTHIQKGMNYDKAVERARQEAAQQARDSWIADQGYEWHGKPIKTEAEYKQALQEQELENRIKQQYSNVPDELLNELVESKRFREETLAEKKAREEKEAEHKQYTDFLEAYPDVKPEDIPVEVWKEHKEGRSLTEAYMRYENQHLKGEMAKYQTQQQIEQANNKNAATSTGSAKTSGKTGGFISKEDFEANKHDMKWVQKNLSTLDESRKHW